MRARAAVLGLLASAVTACGGSNGGGTPTATPVPVTQEVLAVPPGIASAAHPVFWYRDGDHSLHLLAFDWNGARAGELRLHASAPIGITPSADGSRLLVTGAATVGGATVLRRWAGNSAVWSDDTHMCEFRPRDGHSVPDPMGPPVATTLWLLDLAGGHDRRVLDFGSYGAHGGPVVLMCDAAHDRALIGDTFTASFIELRMVRLHDGATLPLHLPVPTERGLIVSADARYAAYGDTVNSWGGPGPPGFDVLDTATGAALRHVSTGGLAAFSGDGTRALVVAWQNNSTEVGRFSVVDWRTGAVLSSRLSAEGRIRPRPDSGDFLFGEAHRTDSGAHSAATITEDAFILRADGSAVHVASGLGALW